jgi:very-short-patch-repair endonuclease
VPEIRDAARVLRSAMTPAESSLWAALRKTQIDGVRFRRQHAIGRFVLDFYAPSHKLAIEVDGAVHDTQQERDAERTRLLALRGIRVIRFRNDEVEANLAEVVEKIRWELRFQADGEPEP